MKNIKIIVVTLIISIISTFLCIVPTFASDQNYDYAEDQLIDMCESDYAYSYLGKMAKGESLQALYREINTKAKLFHIAADDVQIEDIAAFSVNYSEKGLTKEEAKLVWRFFREDHPLYYWIANKIENIDGNIVIDVESDFKESLARKNANKNIYSQINAFLADTKDLTSPYLFALACHDMIIDKIDYAYESDGVTPQDDYWAHSILGVFDVGGGVCESYARTFSLLLNARGIENTIVTGDAGGPHAWNIAKMDDGNWYWFDLTWDDNPGFIDGIDYRYFCVNDTQDIKWIDGPWIPEADWDGNFTEKHKFYTPENSGDLFQYALPERSKDAFSSKFAIRTEFESGDFDYIITGDRKVYVTEIDGEGFVTIPETVEYRGVSYFVVGAANVQGRLLNGRESVIDDDVTGLSIPKTLTFIWDYVFCNENKDFEGYVVDPENPAFCSENGVLYTKDKSVLIGFPAKTEQKVYSLPAETCFIAAGAFDVHNLKELNIHKDVISIGIRHKGYGYNNKVFITSNNKANDNYALAKIRMGAENYKFLITIDAENPNFKVADKGIYSANGEILYGVATPAIPGKFEIASGTKTVEFNALAGLDALLSLTVPASMESMDYGAIQLCPKHVEIYNYSAINMTGWTQDVYTARDMDSKLIFENGFAYFGNKLYLLSYYGEDVEITLPDGLMKVDKVAFKGRTDIESITIPAYIIADDYILADDVFEDCTSLKTITADVKSKEWSKFASRLDIDDDFENTTVICKDGKVVYTNGQPETVVYGDVDGNGEVTVKDSIDMLSCILNNTAQSSFDVSGDGKVTVVDVILLMKYIAGYNVTLH